MVPRYYGQRAVFASLRALFSFNLVFVFLTTDRKTRSNLHSVFFSFVVFLCAQDNSESYRLILTTLGLTACQHQIKPLKFGHPALEAVLFEVEQPI